jgi:hypothetical protein
VLSAAGPGPGCPRCGGVLLAAAAAQEAVVRVGVRPEVWRALVQQPYAGKPCPCPRCGGAAARVALRGQPVVACRACGSLWRPAEPSPSAPEPTPGSPRLELGSPRRPAVWALAGGSLALVVALVLVQRARGPERPSPASAPSASTAIPLGAAAPVAAAGAAPAQVRPAPQALLAGRTPEQWRERLEALRRGGPRDAELYQLTRWRAEANGLVVEEATDGLKVELRPGATGGAR